jgi:hypothetical protein
MIQYFNTILYITLGLFGAYLHYFKKRWIDDTTRQSIADYLFDDKVSTNKALCAICASSFGLALSIHDIHFPSINELVGAVTAGYVADSSLNRAYPKDGENK